jgi:hypothetical protein
MGGTRTVFLMADVGLLTIQKKAGRVVCSILKKIYFYTSLSTQYSWVDPTMHADCKMVLGVLLFNHIRVLGVLYGVLGVCM